MREFFFANCRLLVDEAIADHESMCYLSAFCEEMPYDHTFTLHLGDLGLLDERYDLALIEPIVNETSGYELHKTNNGWSCISKSSLSDNPGRSKYILECSRDYSEMTLYCAEDCIYYLRFKTIVRIFCGVGMAFAGGLSLHASLVEKDGYGVLFVGPSGMGKSTQARLWEKYQSAEIINGDSPVIYRKDGDWYAAGLPWDGKDDIFIQRNLPIKAIIVLEQANENKISKMEPMQAMSMLMQLIMYPFWDQEAMGFVSGLMFDCANKVPFYHLKDLPNEDAVLLTHRIINEQGA